MIFNLFIVSIYIVFYLNFFLTFTFTPSLIFYLLYPEKSIKFFNAIKNIIINSISFISKILLFKNVYVNSNDVMNEFIKCNKKLLISNHPSELDFLITSLFFSNTNIFNKNIGLAKKMVGFQIPILGFFGLLTGDVFLHRNINNRNNDVNKLNNKLNFNSLIIYPEGSCFNNNKKNISDNYCIKNKLITFNYHLYPRMTGLELIFNNNDDIKYIYDLTIIYDKIINNYGNHYNIINYLIGKFKIPHKIYIQLTKYKINNKKKFNKKIIENIFLSKDNFIKNFDINCNNFISINYNYYNGLSSFLFINFVCLCSIYFCYNYSFFKYLYACQLVVYYLYFLLFV